MVVRPTEDFLQKDAETIWHSMKKYNPASTMIVKDAQGSWITDVDGNKYMDAMSGLWCVNVGYGRKELAKAAYDQMIELPYFPLTQSHIPAIKLAEKLNKWLDDDYVFFFSNSGSEANEVAFKITRQYHRQNNQPDRWKFISRYRAYHGNSMGALGATGQAMRKYRYEPLGQGFLHVAPPDCYRSSHRNDGTCCTESAKDIERVMTWELDETIAGVIMEPIITGGGVLVPHDHYLKDVRKICDDHGALLIIDEVINGFGRTGKPFGFMHYGIKPDMITMAKGLTSAYLPLSATAVRKDIYEAFKGTEDYDHFRHINTFGGNPAACAVALKNLEILEEENLIERAAELGDRLTVELAELHSHPNVGDIRIKGLLVGIELVESKASRTPIHVDIVQKVIGNCKERGLIIGKNGDTVAGYNNILTLSPPLSMTDEDFAFMVSTLKASIWAIQF
ncbi:aspartate aminotransferase family protein [Aquibacillus koreensis]|uniref:Aspartate aminotransferase family protein n=1 Tax=Aquibacillus koreensis TaxID=279446 RepID=A0A9X4ALK1_9BACI|nr:aspartate aminotransferase family protein [Aquibacillus koreensis]MCT2535365.1 aspartate aminotransferase family protein [Aquibacillus koreensis]MDC3422530.1 aspartate aminotransferase family protein [Aquibacillus koreensis]